MLILKSWFRQSHKFFNYIPIKYPREVNNQNINYREDNFYDPVNFHIRIQDEIYCSYGN